MSHFSLQLCPLFHPCKLCTVQRYGGEAPNLPRVMKHWFAERERDLVVCPIPFCRKVPISTSAQKDQDVWTLIAYTFCPACPRVWAWGSPPHAPHPSHLQSPPMSHYTKDVWVLLGTVARSTHFWRRLREGGAPGEENKNLLEGRSAMASYLIRGSILSSPLHNFESHSSGDQERYNEFIFKVFFFSLTVFLSGKLWNLELCGKHHPGWFPVQTCFPKRFKTAWHSGAGGENTTLRPGWLVLAVTLQRWFWHYESS